VPLSNETRGPFFWYPTWLAQPALWSRLETGRCAAARLKFEDIAPELKNRDLVVMHTSTHLQIGREDADMIKAANPDIRIGFIGASRVDPRRA